MRLTTALALPLLLSLAACGGGRPKGVVKFTGLPPNSAAQKAQDNRAVSISCPGRCGSAIAYGTTRCTVKRCEVQIGWDKSYTCPSCRGSGACTACVLLEQKDGKCFDCAGAGIKTYAGKTPECPNCKGKKLCPICEGSTKCDYCKGAGRLDESTVQTLAASSAPKAEGEAAQPQEEK